MPPICSILRLRDVEAEETGFEGSTKCDREIQKGPKVAKKEFVHKLHCRSSDLNRDVYFL